MTTRAKTVYARVAGSVAVPDDPAIRRATALVVVMGGHLAAGQNGGQFSLVAEIPLLLHITTTASRLP